MNDESIALWSERAKYVGPIVTAELFAVLESARELAEPA